MALFQILPVSLQKRWTSLPDDCKSCMRCVLRSIRFGFEVHWSHRDGEGVIQCSFYRRFTQLTDGPASAADMGGDESESSA
jgi:hypothetical protein